MPMKKNKTEWISRLAAVHEGLISLLRIRRELARLMHRTIWGTGRAGKYLREKDAITIASLCERLARQDAKLFYPMITFDDLFLEASYPCKEMLDCSLLVPTFHRWARKIAMDYVDQCEGDIFDIAFMDPKILEEQKAYRQTIRDRVEKRAYASEWVCSPAAALAYLTQRPCPAKVLKMRDAYVPSYMEYLVRGEALRARRIIEQFGYGPSSLGSSDAAPTDEDLDVRRLRPIVQRLGSGAPAKVIIKAARMNRQRGYAALKELAILGEYTGMRGRA
jgi:hypothetical protein